MVSSGLNKSSLFNWHSICWSNPNIWTFVDLLFPLIIICFIADDLLFLIIGRYLLFMQLLPLYTQCAWGVSGNSVQRAYVFFLRHSFFTFHYAAFRKHALCCQVRDFPSKLWHVCRRLKQKLCTVLFRRPGNPAFDPCGRVSTFKLVAKV